MNLNKLQGNKIEEICVHFDIDKHYIKAYDFVQTVHSVQLTYNDFNKNILNNKLKFEIVVLPAEDGSFKQKLGIVILAGATSIATMMLSGPVGDYASGFTEELLGKPVSSYGKEHARFLADTFKSFYTMSSNKLKKVIPNELNLDASIISKSDFYNMCASNKEIKGVGFDNTEYFPVDRRSFYKHMSDDIIRPQPSEYFIKELNVLKPVTVDSKAKWAKWYLRDIDSREYFNAVIDDTTFKNDFLDGKYPLKESRNTDKILAHVEYEKELKNGKEETKNISILEVYSFNGKEIKATPENYIQNKPTSKPNNGQTSLLDKLDWEAK